MTQGGNSRPDGVTWPDALAAPVRALQAEPLLYVAFSGGLDSTVLLHAVCHCLPTTGARLRAIHVNHQLQPNANETETFCRRQCTALGVELIVERVSVAASTGPASGLELAARKARYAVFERHLSEGGVLLMAHHQDDQAETVLFRLIRGTGLAGLAGIPHRRKLGNGWLVRPFLSVPQARLKAWAMERSMQWVDDPSNDDERFDRNFLRHTIVPLLKRRWPTLLGRLGRTAEACQEGALLAESLAKLRFDELSGSGGQIDVEGFNALSLPEQKNLLRWWVARNGYRMPELRSWPQVISGLVRSREDAEPEIRGEGFSIRRFQSALYLVTKGPGYPSAALTLVPEQTARWGSYRMTLHRADALCTQIPRIKVACRQGGERIRPRPNGPSKPLKKWLQECAVPPWEQAQLPILSVDGELVGVGAIWLSSRFEGDAPESGWRIVVERDCD